MASEFVGILCTRCDHEYLIADVLNAKNSANANNDHAEFELFNRRLYRNIQKDESEFNAGKLTDVDDITVLKRGDHFALDRIVYTHHGIVSHIDNDRKQFEVSLLYRVLHLHARMSFC